MTSCVDFRFDFDKTRNPMITSETSRDIHAWITRNLVPRAFSSPELLVLFVPFRRPRDQKKRMALGTRMVPRVERTREDACTQAWSTRKRVGIFILFIIFYFIYLPFSNYLLMFTSLKTQGQLDGATEPKFLLRFAPCFAPTNCPWVSEDGICSRK